MFVLLENINKVFSFNNIKTLCLNSIFRHPCEGRSIFGGG